MAKHRQTETKRVNPLLGGALLAGAMLVAAPAGMALADTNTGVGARPTLPHAAPGVEAAQTAGDKVFNGSNTIPGFLGGGPISLDTTGAGSLYHAEFGYSQQASDALGADGPGGASQGLSVGVVNSFTTNYKLTCNLVVQTACGRVGHS